jgi:hypothetical protein
MNQNMNIKHLDAEQLYQYLYQKGYNPQDMLEILNRCDSLVKIRSNMVSEAEIIENKVELIEEVIENKENEKEHLN